MKTISVGSVQNYLAKKAENKKAVIQNAVIQVKKSSFIGFKIVWFGFCSSVVVYMVVKAVMLALQ